MLVFGEIISIKEHKAKIKIHDMDEYETTWLQLPQMCTLNDKSSNICEIGSEVAAIMTENFQDGCIIGSLYNDEDLSITDNSNIKYIYFSDGSLIEYNKETHNFKLDIKGLTTIKSSQKVVFDCEVEINKSLKVSENISDSKGSMQEMREIFNEHTHGNGNNGANTSSPNSTMA